MGVQNIIPPFHVWRREAQKLEEWVRMRRKGGRITHAHGEPQWRRWIETLCTRKNPRSKQPWRAEECPLPNPSILEGGHKGWSSAYMRTADIEACRNGDCGVQTADEEPYVASQSLGFSKKNITNSDVLCSGKLPRDLCHVFLDFDLSTSRPKSNPSTEMCLFGPCAVHTAKS